MRRCSYTYGDSSQCKRIVSAEQSHCYSHDPHRSDERKRNAARGGKRGGRGRVGGELVRVKAEIQEVIEAVRSEALERSTGAVVFQGYNILLRALDTERRIRETDELARQVEELALIVDMTKNKERRG
jgi:hypothetical protein